MDKQYTIYCHINKQNGKRYIGQTCQQPEKRWKNGEGYKGSPHFYSAISLYGWDGFTHEILATGLSKEEADAMEIQLIAEYQTQNPLYGYNIAAGGGGTTGRHHTEETKRKISEGNRGKIETEETKKKKSNSHKNMSEEKQINILKSQGCLPVECIETGVIYYCMQKAGEFAGVCSDSIRKCCNGVHKTAGGYHWQRVTWEEYEAQEATKNAKGGAANGSC